MAKLTVAFRNFVDAPNEINVNIKTFEALLSNVGR